MSCTKTAEQIEMLFGFELRWANENVLDGVQIPTCEGAILRLKSGWPSTCLDKSSSRYTQSAQQVAEPVGRTVWMLTGVC